MEPQTKLTKEPQDKKKEVQQHTFKIFNKIVSRVICLAYPGFNSVFEIYTDASKTQMGEIIVQNNMPLGFYSRALNAAQLNYTTTEKELLSIV